MNFQYEIIMNGKYYEKEVVCSCSFDGIISGNGSSDNGVSGGISLGYETVLFKQKS